MHMFSRWRALLCGQRGYGNNSWFFLPSALSPPQSPPRSKSVSIFFIFYFFHFIIPCGIVDCAHLLVHTITDSGGRRWWGEGFRKAGRVVVMRYIREPPNIWFPNPRENVKLAARTSPSEEITDFLSFATAPPSATALATLVIACACADLDTFENPPRIRMPPR